MSKRYIRRPDGTLIEDNGTAVDSSLTIAGVAADAKAVGDKIDEVSKAIADKRTSAMWYGETKDANYNNAVVVTTTGDFKLTKGARLGVRIVEGDGVGGINVDGTGTVKIVGRHYKSGEIDEDIPKVYMSAGQVLWLTYDGEYFILDDTVRATDDTVGVVSLANIRNEAKKNHYTKTEIDNKFSALDTTLDEKIANLGGGMNATAKSLLITILRNGVYTSDQSANITALENALNESGGDDDTEGGVTQTGSTLYITGGVTAIQSGTTLKIT